MHKNEEKEWNWMTRRKLKSQSTGSALNASDFRKLNQILRKFKLNCDLNRWETEFMKNSNKRSVQCSGQNFMWRFTNFRRWCVKSAYAHTNTSNRVGV